MQSPVPPGLLLGVQILPPSFLPEIPPFVFLFLALGKCQTTPGPAGARQEQGVGQEGWVGTVVGGFTVMQESGLTAMRKLEAWILLEICGKLFQTLWRPK